MSKNAAHLTFTTMVSEVRNDVIAKGMRQN